VLETYILAEMAFIGIVETTSDVNIPVPSEEYDQFVLDLEKQHIGDSDYVYEWLYPVS
jgi:predicted transcriptional regulator